MPTLATGSYANLGGTAVTADGNSATLDVTEAQGDSASRILAHFQGAGGTGTTPTLTAKIQGSFDGTNWFDIVAFTAVAAVAFSETKVYEGALPPRLRVNYDIGGITPSYTFNLWVAIS